MQRGASLPPPEAALQTRTQRRVLQTRGAIEDAFIDLVLTRGYENVTVEDVAEAADVAKATVYTHYDGKQGLLAAVFARLNDELARRITYREGPWTEVRHGAMEAAYRHAAEMGNLYRVCLSTTETRTAYLDRVAASAEHNFRHRLKAIRRKPRVPVEIMARAFAGAHVALLEAWLSGAISAGADDMASSELDVLMAGLAWSHNLSLDDVGYPTPPPLRRGRSR